MSLLERIEACHRWDPADYRPFVVAGQALGRIGQAFARRLADFPQVFTVSDRAVELAPRLGDFQARTAALAEILPGLCDEGLIGHWRDEPYPVLRQWGDEPLLQIERAAVPCFGVRGFGVHLNGYVRKASGLHLWVGKRSMTKPTGPGKLDHLVAGGQPHGISLRDNLIKECAEEAGMAADLAARAEAVSALQYITTRDEGLRDDVVFCYDLEVPEDFVPRNTDGEVEAFYLWPIEQVAETLASSEAFKFNVALVKIDFLARHGVLTADAPDYPAILEGLGRVELP